MSGKEFSPRRIPCAHGVSQPLGGESDPAKHTYQWVAVHAYLPGPKYRAGT